MSVPPEGSRSGLRLPPAAVVLLAGAALGACESAFRLAGGADPSVARRVVPVMAYGTALTALAFLGVHATGRLVLSVGKGRTADAVSSWPATAGWWAGAVFLAVAVAWFGPKTVSRPTGARLLALAVAIGLSILAGWIARWIASRRAAAPLAASLRRGAQQVILASVCVAATVAAWGLAIASLPAEPAGKRAAAAPGRSGRPNVVLIVAYTLRADALGAYGGEEARTPVLDGLARNGALFENVTAPSSWTLPSVVSIFTSQYPNRHGFTDFEGVVPDGVETLAETFRSAGYRCAGFVGNPLMAHARGFDRGFDTYDVYDYEIEGRLSVARAVSGLFRLTGLFRAGDAEKHLLLWPDPDRFPYLTTRVSFYVHDEELNERFDRLAGSAGPSDGRPLFLYVHYVSPHTPYLEHPFRRIKSQPALVRSNAARLQALYAGEVAYMDSVIGDLLGRLEAIGALDGAVVAFTSDHGEEFLEHGRWEHGHSVYQEVIAVPLILSGEGVPPGLRVSSRADLLDVAPTLLDLAGIDPPEHYAGRSLTGALSASGRSTDAPRAVFSEVTSRYLNPKADFHAALLDRWKLIRRRRPSGRLLDERLFDLRADPAERNPLEVAAADEAGASLAARLDRFERERGEGSRRDLSDEEVRRLRALGYLE